MITFSGNSINTGLLTACKMFKGVRKPNKLSFLLRAAKQYFNATAAKQAK